LDPDNNYNLSKELVASAIEELVEEDPLPKLLYQTLQKLGENQPALRSFLLNILQRATRTHPDDSELKALLVRLSEKPKDQSAPTMTISV
jgi:hypothetical protein